MEKYRDSSLPIKERVTDLLSRMTIDEKLEQLCCPGNILFDKHYQNIQEGKNSMKGSIYTFRSFDVAHVNRLQEFCMKNTRLGIPLLVACEGTHGMSLPMGTIFPTTGCIAATFDENYAYKMAVAESKEARACGFNQMYAPNLDLLQDARWGRSEENFGEDPYLTSQMGVAVVRGMQENGVASTIKHYLAYGTPESGLNFAPTHMGVREVREYMLPPFAAAVRAGAMGVMPSYNEIDGVPVHISKYWMKDVLREELGFEGMTITDYGMSGLLLGRNACVETELELAELFLDLQINMEASVPHAYSENTKKAIERDEISLEKLDKVVGQVLKVKFALGLFENPYCDEKHWQEKVFTKEHRQLCREIAEKGIVLLENNGVLPLKKRQMKIGLFGPNAEIAQLGDYCYYSLREPQKGINCVADQSITLKQALIEKYGEQNVVVDSAVGFASYDEKKVKDALNKAKDVDVIIFAGGQNSIAVSGGDAGGESNGRDICDSTITSGEGYDTSDTDLSQPQKKFLKKLSKIKKPKVLVLYGGKPTSITDELPFVDAVLLAFGVGSDGNSALVDILDGTVCPSGKLPFSIPRSVGQIPCYYNHKKIKMAMYNETGHRCYVFDTAKPLYSFGYGLSYTKFTYDSFTAERKADCVEVKIKVANIGDFDTEESVLVFARNVFTKIVTGMDKKLVAYKRIALKKGENKEIYFSIPIERFSYIGVDGTAVAAHGKIKLFIENQEIEFDIGNH